MVTAIIIIFLVVVGLCFYSITTIAGRILGFAISNTITVAKETRDYIKDNVKEGRKK